MATCKDCIHYEVCLNGICDEYFTEDTPQDLKVMFSPIGCENFKNKADFVEVPCRCKDCKHWQKYNNTAGAGNCMYKEFAFNYANEHTFNPITLPTHYCGYGERK